MKRILVLLVFSLCVANASAAVTPIEDTTKNRIKEANHYLSVMPPKDMFADMVQKMTVQIQEDKRQLFTDLMNKNIDLEQLTSIIRDAMVKNFSAEELQALANFFGSPVGKSAMKKFGQYMADAMPHIQSFMMNAFQKTKAEMEKK